MFPVYEQYELTMCNVLPEFSLENWIPKSAEKHIT